VNTENVPKVDFSIEKPSIFIIFLHTLNCLAIYTSATTNAENFANQLRDSANQFQNCVAVTAHYC